MEVGTLRSFTTSTSKPSFFSGSSPCWPVLLLESHNGVFLTEDPERYLLDAEANGLSAEAARQEGNEDNSRAYSHGAIL